MLLGFRRVAAPLFFGMAFVGLPCCPFAQQVQPTPPVTTAASASPAAIPDAPTPQIELAAAVDPQAGQAQSAQSAAAAAPAANSAGQSQTAQQPAAGSVQPQNSAGPTQSPAQSAPATDPAAATPSGALKNGATQNSSSSQTQYQKAAQQIKEQEHQRVEGVVPMFNTTYHWDAASMTAGQKMGLALRSTIDPFQFAAAFLVAGYHEALNQDTGFGWGAEGLGKRAGAAYLDAFDGDIIGNGILPAVLRQDPRFFRMGPAHGTVMHRMLYALATNVIARHDNTGKWEPNYSNVGGNIIAGAISNLYYPSQNSGWGQTISNGMIVTAEGGIGSLFQEFWPDISRKVLHKDPTHGLDAQAAGSGNASTPK